MLDQSPKRNDINHDQESCPITRHDNNDLNRLKPRSFITGSPLSCQEAHPRFLANCRPCVDFSLIAPATTGGTDPNFFSGSVDSMCHVLSCFLSTFRSSILISFLSLSTLLLAVSALVIASFDFFNASFKDSSMILTQSSKPDTASVPE